MTTAAMSVCRRTLIAARMHMNGRSMLAAIRRSSSAAEQPTEQTTEPPVVSSCKEGTVLKGLNVYKDGKDPVAMADTAYPPWLWTLLDKPKATEKPVTEEEKFSTSFLRKLSAAKIEAFAMSKRSK